MVPHFLFPNRSSPPARDADGGNFSLDLDREEIVTAIATVLAVLVVAAIAALMGMS